MIHLHDSPVQGDGPIGLQLEMALLIQTRVTADVPFSGPGSWVITELQLRAFHINSNAAASLCEYRLFAVMKSGHTSIGVHERGKRLAQQALNPLLCRSFGHRSISPRTISIDPITATTSAISRPTHMVSSACSVANDGLRM